MNPDQYCREKGAPTGSTAYYRQLFLSESRQRPVTALYAFCREVRSITHEVSEVDAARMKLAWWQAEIERLYAGTPQHPVTRTLHPFLEQHALERALFDQVLAAAESDIDRHGYQGFDDLLVYLRNCAAAQRVESELCGYREDATRDFAEQLGIALRLARILRDVRTDAAQGRVYLPADRMQAHGVSPRELLRPSTPDSLRALLRAEMAGAHRCLDQALQTLPPGDHHAQCSGLVAAAIERRLLAEIERDGYRVLDHRIDLTPVRKLWIAWRTARAARRTAARPRSQRS